MWKYSVRSAFIILIYVNIWLTTLMSLEKLAILNKKLTPTIDLFDKNQYIESKLQISNILNRESWNKHFVANFSLPKPWSFFLPCISWLALGN